MTFTELKAELAARGFNYLPDARLGNYVNWARADLDEQAPWPYRLASTSGTSPVTIADLGTVVTVVDTVTGQTLPVRDYVTVANELLQPGGTFPAGTPVVAYVTSTGVSAVPTGSNLAVTYEKIGPDLSAGSDVPLAPARFHRLIVDLAVERAYRDNDDHDEAERLRAAIERDLAQMRWVLLRDLSSTRVQITNPW